jgi:hypothetical protein
MSEPGLITLADELLQAHLDTVELAQSTATGSDWQAHLDYLRALLRRGQEVLAAETELAGP